MPQTPCLFAPVDDRNALATPTAGGIVLARVQMHLEADLGREAGALDQLGVSPSAAN